MSNTGNSNSLWDEFILWLALPVDQRGAVASEEEWARSKGYANARQLRRWKQDPRFRERQAELLADRAAFGVTLAPGSPADVVSGDEADYHVVKAQLFDAAKSGNLKATELYMRLYGKSWIEEEAAARSSDFTGVDLDVLVAQALVAVDLDTVISVLEDAGWCVARAESKDASAARVS